jgi:hypothetical protein
MVSKLIAKLLMLKTQAKILSENLFVRLEERRTSPRMGLPISPSSKEMRLVRERA